MKAGDRIIFRPGGNPPGRKGRFVKELPDHPGVVHVRLDTDPFDVCVTSQYVIPQDPTSKTDSEEKHMPTTTATKPKAKDLRREAKALGVEGWEDMDLDGLIEAVAEAKEGAEPVASTKKSAKKAAAAPAKENRRKPAKAAAAPVEDEDDDEDDDEDEEEVVEAPAPKSKKGASKKAAAKADTKADKKAAKSAKAAPAKASKKAKADEVDEDDLPENGNPFTPGTNLFHMTEELIKGGKRSAMVKRLSKKISLKPRTRTFTEDEEVAEIDRRLVIVSQVLRNEHGFEMEREGRGADTVIRLWKE